MAQDQVVLVHPDLPGQEYDTNALHAQVLRLSGWAPKTEPEPEPEPESASKPAKAATAKES